jgi:protein-disulfide isomerase
VFAIRYFPLLDISPTNAAIAVELQAEGREAMYEQCLIRREWGEAQESRTPLFRQFAEELGLDLAAYDDAVADPALAERVRSDFDVGVALGVSSTPTFFVNDRMAQLGAFEDLRAAIQAELDR